MTIVNKPLPVCNLCASEQNLVHLLITDGKLTVVGWTDLNHICQRCLEQLKALDPKKVK